MSRDYAIAGIIGVFLGASVYLGVGALSEFVPILLRDSSVTMLTFVFFLLLAVIEIPVMVFGLRQMVHRISTPPRLTLATFGFYVAFASVYASAFVLLTGQIALGLAIVAVCVVRFVSGFWIKGQSERS